MRASEFLNEGKTKPIKCNYCDADATQRLIWADGRGQVAICNKHESNARKDVNKNKHPEIVGTEPL